MKTLISISIAVVFCHGTRAQETPSRKDFVFENQVTKQQVKIETGNKVTIHLKSPDVQVAGRVLFLTDSSMTLGIQHEPIRQIFLFTHITHVEVIVERRKRYIAWVKLKSGYKAKGELIRTTQDSLIMRNVPGLPEFSFIASEIESVRIRRKKAAGKSVAVGAGVGAILGGVVGYASYTPTDCSNTWFCIDLGPEADAIEGAVIGAAAGALMGLLVGSAGKEFKIDGNRAQFDLFVMESK